MSSTEFDIIRRFFLEKSIDRENVKQLERPDVILGIGDDAAVVSPPQGQSLIVTTDTLTSGVHFPEDTSPESVGYKSLAVNLSDLASMGAEPAWFTLSITLPDSNEDWLQQFSKGLFTLAHEHHIQLIGGDTTRGPLCITIQAMGFTPEGEALTRSGAGVGDAVYVTGTIGDASAGLKIKQKQLQIAESISNELIGRLNRPTPRVREGILLRGLASAVIDISDGLGADLMHILTASHVGADISITDIPLSNALQSLEQNNSWQQAVSGGDDYELCFTLPEINERVARQKLEAMGCRCTRIGTITPQPQCLRWRDQEGNEVKWEASGYDHFNRSGSGEC